MYNIIYYILGFFMFISHPFYYSWSIRFIVIIFFFNLFSQLIFIFFNIIMNTILIAIDNLEANSATLKDKHYNYYQLG